MTRTASHERLHALPSPATVGVVRVNGAFRVVAVRDLSAGERVLRFDGVEVDRPSRYSVQVGVDRHVDLPGEVSLDVQIDRYPWRFLNHSCEPNAAVSGRELVALRPIRAWDEVTFDYHTTEYDMAEPFTCQCETMCCVGEVRGFRHLSAMRRARIAAFVAPHVRALADRESRGG